MSVDRSKLRERQREKRIAEAKERLNFKNEFGISDPTPYQAILNINKNRSEKK